MESPPACSRWMRSCRQASAKASKDSTSCEVRAASSHSSRSSSPFRQPDARAFAQRRSHAKVEERCGRIRKGREGFSEGANDQRKNLRSVAGTLRFTMRTGEDATGFSSKLLKRFREVGRHLPWPCCRLN